MYREVKYRGRLAGMAPWGTSDYASCMSSLIQTFHKHLNKAKRSSTRSRALQHTCGMSDGAVFFRAPLWSVRVRSHSSGSSSRRRRKLFGSRPWWAPAVRRGLTEGSSVLFSLFLEPFGLPGRRLVGSAGLTFADDAKKAPGPALLCPETIQVI